MGMSFDMLPHTGWAIATSAAGVVCVYPVADLREHDLDGQCWCGPDTDAWGVKVHRSMDRREEYERGRMLT